MYKIKVEVVIAFCLMLFYSCKSENPEPVDYSNKLSFEVERTNSTNNFISKVISSTLSGKRSFYDFDSDTSIYLIREASFNVKLANSDSFTLKVYFQKVENNRDLLVLEEDSTGVSTEKWDYLTLEQEATRFYKDFSECRISIGTNYLFYKNVGEEFKLKSINQVLYDGKMRNHIVIEFSGIAYGAYDPSGTYQAVYKVTNGTFSGILN